MKFQGMAVSTNQMPVKSHVGDAITEQFNQSDVVHQIVAYENIDICIGKHSNLVSSVRENYNTWTCPLLEIHEHFKTCSNQQTTKEMVFQDPSKTTV